MTCKKPLQHKNIDKHKLIFSTSEEFSTLAKQLTKNKKMISYFNKKILEQVKITNELKSFIRGISKDSNRYW